MIIIEELLPGEALGNCIIQLNNIIAIAIAYKHNILFKKKHSLFNLKLITDYFSKYDNKEIIDKSIAPKWNFFSWAELPYPKEIFYIQNIEEINKIIKEAFLIKDIKKLDETDLVIHIRSGDIFGTWSGWRHGVFGSIHPNYAPPPLSYYTK